MNKIKQVFSNSSSDDVHDNSRTSTGQHEIPGSQNTTSGTHTVGSGSHNGHHSTANAAESALTGNRSSTGTTGERGLSGATGSHGLTENTSSGLTGNTSSTHNTGLTGDSTSHRQHESAGDHLREHAKAPNHTHNQPSEHTHLGKAEAEHATHDHKHLAAVTHEKHHTHTVEEVERQREVDRHVHHVQHHVQPVKDEQHASEVHHQQIHPTSHVQEKHVNTDEDKALLAGLSKPHFDTRSEGAKEHTIIDKGERVTENTSHHVHHVVQPVIERDVHQHHVVHTVIPTHHTTHEAPIVHQSVEHEPMNIKDFIAGGGDLKSKLTHETAGVLSVGDCERDVDGPAESLAQKLHLGSSHHSSGTTGSTGTTGATGNTY